MDLDEVLATVRERVTPDPDERAELSTVAAEVVDRTNAVVAEHGFGAEVRHVGSTARGTWLAGDRDVDVFVRFPPDLNREELTSRGLTVGHEVLDNGREEYAEHPYVTGEIDGFRIDLVPCFAVPAASEGRSAVDRTPFHADYLAGRLTEDHAAEVRVVKAFLTAIGAYGSDLRTRGFSGYLVELLVLEFETVRRLLTTAADWQPPVRLDPAGHGSATFAAPLVVVDPTDPERNVAAALAAENLARFQHYARDLLAEPRLELFEPADPEPVDEVAVRTAFAERETTPVAIRFDAPDVVEDQLYPQLDRSLEGVAGALDRAGFEVLRRARFADRHAVLLVECEVGERPTVERHEGPPVGVRDHAEQFYRTYADADVTGPFLDGDRYVVERDRSVRRPGALLDSEALFGVALGPDVEQALRADYDVLVGAEVGVLAEEFGRELARYLDPSP